ncbi:2-C-methyl-D-erythritol 2,4-cyclodiphosphate synthase [Blastococcus sp. SYSU DS0617]
MVNIDGFVTLGTTGLRPHVQAMRENLAAASGVPVQRISVKARSADGVAPEGGGTEASATVTVLLVVVVSPHASQSPRHRPAQRVTEHQGHRHS